MIVNNIEYNVIKLLGHGKGGYSYLVELDNKYYVLKQIHHEPCSYYTFGNKIESEINDYNKLIQTGIRMPKMIDVDIKNERIIKEYINGSTICELVEKDLMKDIYINQVKEMANIVYSYGLNIDYFPTNFIVQDDLIYYIDYECNNYMEEWDFNNWGIKYWYKSKEFIDYINSKKGINNE
jgi:tRNA A-37 threonylcarbamoyl transferase component Bud32